MSDARMTTAQRFLDALAAPQGTGADALMPLLHPDVRLMRLGKTVDGTAAVIDELRQGANGELSRRLQWQAPQPVVDSVVRLVGERRPGERDRGLVVTLGFDGDAIALVQQQRTPPPPPDAQPLVLPASLKRMIDHALVERHPMLVAYSDPEGQPVLSFRGSVQAYGDDQLAMWIRSPDGAFIRAIRHNPKLALVYRNEETKATYNFQGRARVSDLGSDRRRVFDASPEAERGHDFAMLGVVVLVDLDRVEGYAGLGPAGQVDQIRLVRGTVPN
ncbi:pyridoxamine 5'-phosphate oxidase family protein [Variovorax sp. PBL-E5]|uniref:pyridoxamine 5'-phosphate oxidase family protein n=1 Tax=Variovorax sp. PBL-E5 TaxID=434014 RepID=UPI0013183EFE|nr:pyridoxamine 5'-phosphate oxidase family protein [Variovorax sp. PBL-E5]VTU26008.1 Pyridoxamine 5'-phosphate oxidase [Variovorax sp. PBL-E5]